MATGRARGSRAISDASTPPSPPPPGPRRRPILGRLVGRGLLALGLIVTAAGAIVLSDIDRYFPLDLREPPGVFTQWRIQALAASPETCARVLGRSGVAATAAPERVLADGCGYEDGVAVSNAPLALESPPVMRCPLAAAYAAWELHAVQPAAQARFGVRVVGVSHFGSYSCRNTYGRATGRRSQHATANALDVSGFRLSDGRTITVRSGWNDPGPAGRFLRDLRDGGCGLFAAVLSPDYNAAHHDHFHLDLGPYQVCR